VDASRTVLGLEGCSVTAPHKLAAARASVSRDSVVLRLDAANTLRWSQSLAGWESTNTDLEGFLAPLADVELGASARRWWEPEVRRAPSWRASPIEKPVSP